MAIIREGPQIPLPKPQVPKAKPQPTRPGPKAIAKPAASQDWRLPYVNAQAPGVAGAGGLRLAQLSPGFVKSLLPDVRPSAIDMGFSRGTNYYFRTGAPASIPRGHQTFTTNTILGGAPQVYIGTPQALERGSVGHEAAHVWGRYSMNPIQSASRFRGLVEGLSGRYSQNYGDPLSQEGQASMYYGPPGSTYNATPAWLRSATLAGFLR